MELFECAQQDRLGLPREIRRHARRHGERQHAAGDGFPAAIKAMNQYGERFFVVQPARHDKRVMLVGERISGQ